MNNLILFSYCLFAKQCKIEIKKGLSQPKSWIAHLFLLFNYDVKLVVILRTPCHVLCAA